MSFDPEKVMCPSHLKAQNRAHTRELFKLTSKTVTTPEEDATIKRLTSLIEKFEGEHYPLQKQPLKRRGHFNIPCDTVSPP